MGLRRKAVGDQRLIVAQITNQRVFLNKLKLFLRNGMGKQAFDLMEPPDPVGASQLAGRARYGFKRSLALVR